MTTHSAPRGRSLPFLLAALSAIGPFSIDTFLPALPTIANALHASELAMQQALSVYLFCYGLMMLWHGAISDALGRRPVILAGCALFTLASLGCAQADSLGELLVFRGLQGLCGGAGLIVGRAIIRDCLEGPAAQRLMSQVTMLFSLSPAIAPVVGGWLFGLAGWRSIFIFMASWGLLLSVACWYKLAETHPPAARQSLHPRRLLGNYLEVGRDLDFVLLALAVACNFAGFFLYVPAAPVLLMRHLGLGPHEFIWLFGPSVTGIMLGAWLSGRLAGFWSPGQMVTCGYALMFGAAALNLGYHALWPAALPWTVLPMTLYGVGMSLVAPTITLALMDRFAHLRGTVSSMQGFTQTMLSSVVAGAVAPLLWGSPLRLACGMAGFLCAGFAARSWFRYRLLQNRPG